MTATIDIAIRTLLAFHALLLSFLAPPALEGSAVAERIELSDDNSSSADPADSVPDPSISEAVDDRAERLDAESPDEPVPADDADSTGVRAATAGDRDLLGGDVGNSRAGGESLQATVNQQLFDGLSPARGPQDMTTGVGCSANCIKQGVAIAWSTGTWIEIYTTVPTAYHLEVTGPGYAQTRNGQGGATVHIDRFEGLAPGTTYDAWVMVTDPDGQIYEASGSFTTPS